MLRSVIHNRLSVVLRNNNVNTYQIAAMITNSNQPTDDMPYIVGHDKSRQQFYIKLRNEDGSECPEKAVLDYDWIRPGFADLHHTEVPVSLRGKGIAQFLAQAAFDYIVSVDGKMRLTCTYLQKYLSDHPLPRYKEIVDNKSK